MTYGEWLNTWLYYIRPTVKNSTYRQYRYFSEKLIVPELGGYELDRLNSLVLQNYVTGLARRYSPTSVKCIVSVVKRSLQYAEDMDLISSKVSGKVHYKCKKTTTPKFLTQKDQKKLESYVNGVKSPKLYGFIICLYTGIRVGELLALKWANVDLKNGILHIEKTCHDCYTENGYEKVLDAPKTTSSLREIPLSKQLIAILREQKRLSKSEYVISGTDGRIVSKRSYQNTFRLVLERLRIPHMGVHALRHTFATRALECGMDVKTLSEILGHSNASITMNIYAHSQPEHKRSMMNRLGKMLD